MSAQQIETATVVGIVTLAGNAKAVVTGKYVTGSPVTVSFAVLLADDQDAIALKARTAIALNSAISNQYQVSGATDKIVLTDRTARANDTTLNIATDNNGCTGITAAPASADTLAGSGLTNSYATLADFKVFGSVRGGVVAVDANDDGAIEGLLNTASRYIDGKTRRRFYYNTVDEVRYYTAEDSSFVFVDDLSTDPTSVVIDDDGDRTYGTTMASTDLDLKPYNAITDGWPYTWLELMPFAAYSFPNSRKGVQITGKFGFPVVPDDIKEACLGIALNLYQARTGQTSAGNVTVTASGVVIRPQDVPDWAQITINKYLRIV
jgi:hypothetical protein